MNMFGNLTQDGLEESTDRLGGGGTLESDAYKGTVKLAYAGKARASDAQSVTVHIDIAGFEFRETLWVTNRTGQNFYVDKQDATKKHPLPGFTTADDLCLLTTGHGLSEQAIEEKVVKLYDFEAKKELPQNVPVLTGMIGKEIGVGLIKRIVDKNVKDSAGIYVPSGETREENSVDKFFHAESGRTVAEFKAGTADAAFQTKWAEKNRGKTQNRAKGAPGKAGTPARPQAVAGAKPASSLFGA